MPTIAVPPGYTSPDVIDRRDGQGPTLMERIRQLLMNVRNDYNDTLPNQPVMKLGPDDAYSQGMAQQKKALDDAAVQRIHARVRGLFQEGS